MKVRVRYEWDEYFNPYYNKWMRIGNSGWSINGLLRRNPTLKSSVVGGNRYLTEPEMQINARYIAGEFIKKHGWSLNAVAGMLGNMQAESTINPGIWQQLKDDRKDFGFGLVQWTPSTKFTNWAKERGKNYLDIDVQIERIILEVKNEIKQWESAKNSFDMSFYEYSTAVLPPEKMSEIFLLSYEKPDVKNQQVIIKRGNYAIDWYEYLPRYL